jgi:hypothetical protein
MPLPDYLVIRGSLATLPELEWNTVPAASG